MPARPIISLYRSGCRVQMAWKAAGASWLAHGTAERAKANDELAQLNGSVIAVPASRQIAVRWNQNGRIR